MTSVARTMTTSCAADRQQQQQWQRQRPPWAASATAGTDNGDDLDDVGGLHDHRDNVDDNLHILATFYQCEALQPNEALRDVLQQLVQQGQHCKRMLQCVIWGRDGLQQTRKCCNILQDKARCGQGQALQYLRQNILP